MMNLSPSERSLGRNNFISAVEQLHGDTPCTRPGRTGMTRREFLYTAGAVPAAAGALYFGYESLNGNPVKAGLIGSGDEGLILLTESNPEFIQFIAYSDIRPSQQQRAMDGDKGGGPRLGFKEKYSAAEAEAIKTRSATYHENYEELLKDPDIELVVIALPLHLHAEATIKALKAGKHVLCEKLMARYVGDRWLTSDGQVLTEPADGAKQIPGCKRMIQVAEEEGKLLAIGHQRHYSILYDGAVEAINQGLLGEVKYIRALWHRNNAKPRGDSWNRKIPKEDMELDATKHEYFAKGDRSALRELVNWRLYQRTGGGLMAELGSHQLDACSIFLGKKRPIAVSGIGGKYYYKDDREVDDHVYCTYEFPGKDYQPDKGAWDNDVVVVTYSSINTNRFEGYGECIQGSDATLVADSEKEILLFKESGSGVGREGDGPPRSTHIKVVDAGGSAGPQLDSSGTAGGPGAVAKRVISQAASSRGYREEMEHLAFCIRNNLTNNDLRCNGQVALADAVMALTSNLAMRRQIRVPFQPEWFDPKVIDDPKGDPWTDPRVPS